MRMTTFELKNKFGYIALPEVLFIQSIEFFNASWVIELEATGIRTNNWRYNVTKKVLCVNSAPKSSVVGVFILSCSSISGQF